MIIATNLLRIVMIPNIAAGFDIFFSTPDF